MAVSVSILATCQAAVAALPELAAFTTAFGAFNAGTESNRLTLWKACFDDLQANMSPAYRLKRAIREAIRLNDDGTLSPVDRETLYKQLVAEYVPAPARPNS